MEKQLDTVLTDLMNSDGVSGCIVADKQGLCLGVRGDASTDSSGILTALSEQARKLDPTGRTDPVVLLENDQRQCVIKTNDKFMIALYKDI